MIEQSAEAIQYALESGLEYVCYNAIKITCYFKISENVFLCMNVGISTQFTIYSMQADFNRGQLVMY